MKTLSLATIATVALPGAPSASVLDDQELVRIGEDFDRALANWRKVHAEYNEAYKGLFEPAMQAIPRGLPEAEFMARYEACFDDTGFAPYQEANEMALDLVDEYADRIREIPASSLVGLTVKMRVLRYDLEYALKLESPAHQEELEVEYFNAFQAELGRLALT
jgi:hypothetical protein